MKDCCKKNSRFLGSYKHPFVFVKQCEVCKEILEIKVATELVFAPFIPMQISTLSDLLNETDEKEKE